MQTVRLQIEGMHRVNCAHGVESTLGAVPGVHGAWVQYLRKLAVVQTSGAVSVDELAEAVRAAGYCASPVSG